ncbi:MAG: hypothetical protein JWM57_1460 [Phycisphaerales bacterium]|nr:hypothetical protein [Phycisphaerales bacterium]
MVLGVSTQNSLAQMADHILPAPPPDKTVDDFVSAVAKGDAKRVEALIASQNADEQLLRPGLAGVCAAVGRFDGAVTEAFGPAKAGRWGAATGDVKPRTTRLDAAHAGQLVVVLGTEGHGAVDVPLVQEAGRWRLTFGAVAALMRLRQVEATIPTDEPLRRLTEMAEAIQTVTADVKGRRITSPEAAADAGRAALGDAARGKNAQ